ncbi:OmpP1/FadL family transporter [Rhizobium sp. L1K21]|uniref:OmpP1/FadL family transporter n=1 Tax=Rhizobium sp. L1K21 TaxID=2954933 RepID=UPI0020924880|nr:outer membrane protein transport protein [Rhizobium sp. L1K21]MCO6184962.1 outer membrane protein transport protein [Rhizobium sp. L1K21]
MNSRLFKITFAAFVGTIAATSHAAAGGFSRGDANTDILFENGAANVEVGGTYVSPHRSYTTINGAAGTDPNFSEDYWIPSVAAKVRIFDNLSCAFTYTQPFGGSIKYGPQAYASWASANAKRWSSFDTNEFGSTCDVSFDAGPGRIHFLGGAFLQTFDYKQSTRLGFLNIKDDGKWGYRLGVGYDIPEYALRASLMYRSEVQHKATGTFLFGTTPLSANASGTLPQSVELSLQSGVAPGWLVYGSVKWTDWSVLQKLTTNVQLLGASSDNYFWRDGWTVQGGVAHQFTDDIAGTVNLTWDRGVGTGADIQTDTWTVGLGTEIKAGPGKLQLGAGISYLTAGSQTLAKSGTFAATANGDWAYALRAGYKIQF